MKKLVIFGTAEIAKLAHYYFLNDSDYQVVAFTVDDVFAVEKDFLGLPLVPFSQVANLFKPRDVQMHVALSYSRLNRLRQEKYNQAKKAGYTLASYVCSKSAIWPDLDVGDNCFILENQIIQPTVKIGNNVMIWSSNHIGHGSIVHDHAYISSHVVIAGHCRIGERCFLGINSSIKDFTNIGEDSFVGMSASVTKDIEAGSVVVGASSEIFAPDDRRAQTLKRKYFKV